MLPVLSFVATVVLSMASPALADTGKQSFEHEGTRYVYTVIEKGDARKISGYRYPDAVPFTLTVRAGTVSGFSGGNPVHFSVASAKGAIKRADGQLTMR